MFSEIRASESVQTDDVTFNVIGIDGIR